MKHELSRFFTNNWKELKGVLGGLPTHLLERNGFPEENEFCKNNGRSDCDFSHLVETNTAHELNGEETGVMTVSISES